MPNLADVANNPEALAASVDRMMRMADRERAIRENQGISPEELMEELESAAAASRDNVPDIDIDAYRRLLDPSALNSENPK